MVIKLLHLINIESKTHAITCRNHCFIKIITLCLNKKKKQMYKAKHRAAFYWIFPSFEKVYENHKSWIVLKPNMR